MGRQCQAPSPSLSLPPGLVVWHLYNQQKLQKRPAECVEGRAGDRDLGLKYSYHHSMPIEPTSNAVSKDCDGERFSEENLLAGHRTVLWKLIKAS